MNPTPEFLHELLYVLQVLDPDVYLSVKENNGLLELNYHNAYREYQSALPEKRQEILEKYARVIIAVEVERKQVRKIDYDRVFPIIRRRSYFTAVNFYAKTKQGNQQVSGLWFKAFTSYLAIGLAEDRGEHIHLLTIDEVAQSGMTDRELFNLSLNNLRRDQSLDFKQIGDNAMLSSSVQPGQNSSLILLPEFIHNLPIHGVPVVFLTNPNRLFITGLEHLNSSFLEEVLQMYKQTDHQISATPLMYANGSWAEACQINDTHRLLEVGRTIWLSERLDEAKRLRQELIQFDPNLFLPPVVSLGMNLNVLESNEQKLVCVTGTDSPLKVDGPFMLTEALMYALPDMTPKLLWTKSLLEVVPDVLVIDDQYEPPICHFKRLLTQEEIAQVQKVQNAVFQHMFADQS